MADVVDVAKHHKFFATPGLDLEHPNPAVMGTAAGRPAGHQRATGNQGPLVLVMHPAGNGHVGVGHALNIEIEDLKGVFFDEIAARLHLVAHKRGKHQVGRHPVFDVDLEQTADARIHRRFPQLFRVHFP